MLCDKYKIRCQRFPCASQPLDWLVWTNTHPPLWSANELQGPPVYPQNAMFQDIVDTFTRYSRIFSLCFTSAWRILLTLGMAMIFSHKVHPINHYWDKVSKCNFRQKIEAKNRLLRTILWRSGLPTNPLPSFRTFSKTADPTHPHCRFRTFPKIDRFLQNHEKK